MTGHKGVAVHRLSGIDAAFLYGETEAWHMHVSMLVVVGPRDGTPLGFEQFRTHIAARVHLAPQFTWKLVEVPLGLDRPVLVDDPGFDCASHIQRLRVPAPGTDQQLCNLVGELVATKLDRSRPLWEMWFIDGLPDGRVAILAKVHHAIVDGVTGSEVAMVLMDLEPDAAVPEPPEPVDANGSEDNPDRVELLLRGVASAATTPVRTAQLVVSTVRQGVRLVSFRRRRKPPPVPFEAPRVSFNNGLSPHRRFAFTSVDLGEVRRIKDAAGVKVNDVVLALCAGSLRRYLEARNELPDVPLIAQVPVSTRSDGDHQTGTKVSAMFASLATNIADPAERLQVIAEGTRGSKEMQQALAAEKIIGISEAAPPLLFDLASRMFTLSGLERGIPPVMNTIISNIPGPPMPIWCAGQRVEALYPMGPLLYGTGLNITVFSYVDRMDFGFLVCEELVPRPQDLADGVHGSLAELAMAFADIMKPFGD